MKLRLRNIIIPLTLMFFLASCGMNTVNVEALKKTKKVALISVFSKNEIDTSKVDEGSLLAMVANTVASGDDTLMAPKMEALKAHVLEKAPSIFGFQMVSEKQVIGRKVYKSINDSNKNMSNLVGAPGYKRIFSNEKELVAKALKGIRGVDAAMILHMNMRLVKGIGAVGVGKAYLWADMTFYLVDKQGNLILHKTASNESDTATLRVAGIFNGNDIQGMAVEAVEKDLKEVAAWIKEEMKKPAKKNKI